MRPAHYLLYTFCIRDQVWLELIQVSSELFSWCNFLPALFETRASLGPLPHTTSSILI
jgi:hypothetical protein